MSAPIDLSLWSPSIGAYASWLDREDFDAAGLWAKRLKSKGLAHVEGAVAEAVAWDFLSHRVDEIRPGSISEGGPDFRCVRNGRTFFVEVTNLSRALVTKRTGLTEEVDGAQTYGDLTGLIKQEVKSKAGRASNLGAPHLVFVTTLHGMASQVCVDRAHVAHVLHSTTGIGGSFDAERGEIVGPLREFTRMELSAFTQAFTVDPARRNVSAVLVGGFGTYPDVRVLGVRHPDPVHSFDPALFEDVPFFEFTTWPPNPRVMARWTLPEAQPRLRGHMKAWIEIIRRYSQ